MDFNINKYKKNIILLGLFIIIDVIAPLVFNVMGIQMNTFMVYLIWLNALLISYIILPSKVGNAFYDD